MSCHCSGACWLIGLCIAQLVTITVRQTFDYLGFQWTAIVVNFCQIIGVTIGLFGTCRNKPRLVAVYSTWTLIWMGWNIFLVFFYFGVGVLDVNKHMIALNLGLTDSFSWFRVQCYPKVADNVTTTASASLLLPWFCVFDYEYFEVGQSSLQMMLAIFGFSVSCYVIGVLREEEDSFDLAGAYGTSSRKRKHISGVSSPHLQPLVGAVSSSSTA